MYLEEEHDIVIDEISDNLDRIRRFSGPPIEFWPAFLEWSARVSGAKLGLLLVRGEDDSWKSLSAWPAKSRDIVKASNLENLIEEIAEASALKGFAWSNFGQIARNDEEWAVLGARIQLEEEQVTVAVFLLDNDSRLSAEEAAIRLLLIADTPAVYQLARLVCQARLDVANFSEALDLMVLLNEEKRYVGAAMTFCKVGSTSR